MGATVFWGIGRNPLPLIRFSLSWYDNQVPTANEHGPSSHFGLFAAVSQLCWSQRPSNSVQFAVAGCAGLESGLYRVNGIAPKSSDGASTTVINVYTHSLLWASVLVSVPVRLNYREMFFELVPESRVPLVSGKFHYVSSAAPSYQPVYEIPHIALGIGFATGLTFP